MTELGARLAELMKKARIDLGIEQKQAALDIGISSAKLGHYENGRAEPDIDTLYLICSYYGQDINDWLGLDTGDLRVIKKDERLLIENYRSLPSSVKSDILLITDTMAKKYLSLKAAKAAQEKSNIASNKTKTANDSTVITDEKLMKNSQLISEKFRSK